jgi:hypothetical protein
VSVCLLAFLPACASKPTTRTETVEIRVPVYVPVPAELTREVAEPKLPADMPAYWREYSKGSCPREAASGPVLNCAFVDWADALRAALRAANGKLRELAGLQPEPVKAGE